MILFGTGQNAEVAYYYFKHDSPHEIVAFTLDREWMKRDSFHNLPIIAFDEIENVYPPEKYKMFVSISFTNLNKLRKKKYQEAKDKGYELISYVCSRATTWPNLDIGDNCFIFEDNVIQPYVKIGNNVILFSASTFDLSIPAFAQINPCLVSVINTCSTLMISFASSNID